MRNRQAAQQNRVHDRENCGIRADAQREREDGRQSKAAVLAQLPPRVPHVLMEFINQPQAERLPAGVLGVHHTPQGPTGRGTRDLWTLATRDVFAGLTIQMKAQFGIHFTFKMVSPSEPPNTRAPSINPRHRLRSFV